MKNIISMRKVSLPKINLSRVKIRKDLVFGIMCYLHILAIIPYFFERKDYFVQYHSKQGIALLIVWAIGLFSFYLPVVPYIFAILIAYFMISGLKNIVLRKESPLPIIGKWAENLDI